ncbi:MAG: DNA mismatch endonuclease Vsr [Rhodothermales bacterium]|nr:DNA mismatch endonuclease Vsr [Rhodothermales bacterium]
MVDVHDAETRRKNMRAIKHKDTRPEWAVRRYLHGSGLRYRLHQAKLPGKPDIVLRKHSAVVFVHGCYWHRHPNCRYATLPKTRTKFWKDKLEGNRARDLRHQIALEEQGWRVFVIWECQLKTDECLEKLVRSIKGDA